MTNQDTGGPAFASAGAMDTTQGSAMDGDRFDRRQPGMTLLDYFAGKAIQGLLSEHWAIKDQYKNILPFTQQIKPMSEAAYTLAKAMIAEKRRIEGNDEV